MTNFHITNRVLNYFGLRLERTSPAMKSGAIINKTNADIRPAEKGDYMDGIKNNNDGAVDAPAPAPSVTSTQNQSSPAAAVDSGGASEPAVLAHDELARIRAEMPAIFERAAKKVVTGELGLIGWGLTLPRVQKLAQEHGEKPWFFIGDIHGDFLAWFRLFERVRKEKEFRLCFLGDLVDRGPLHIECFAAIMEAIERYPGQILWIVGNHDDAVRWSPQGSKFLAAGGIEPAEFVDWLNSEHREFPRDQVQKWGRLFADVVARLPRAVLLQNGLLAAHGGVPLKDRWEFLKTMEAFHNERCLGDFTWARLVNYPSRVGWKTDRRQYSSDFGIGYTDLEGFCQAVQAIYPVKQLVCGHEHVENGFERPDCYKKTPVLKLNGFGFDYLSNSVRKYRKTLVIGIGQIDQLPKVEELSYLQAEYNGVYPETTKPDEQRSNDSAPSSGSTDKPIDKNSEGSSAIVDASKGKAVNT